MSVAVLYSAIPPQSSLYTRLQQEKAFAILMVGLFPYGNGIFRFFEIDHDEVEEIFECMMENHRDTLGSELEAKRWFNEFQAELERTRRSYPGIEDRRASFEKTSTVIEKQLVQELTKNKQDGVELVNKLMFGDQSFASHLLSPEDSLRLVSLPLVQQGASILQGLPQALFDDPWDLEQFQGWRELYFAAAEKNEEILVGIA